MALNASGPISLGGSTVGQSINLELGKSATALASMNATDFRTLAGVASGQISISNFYGKSNTTYYWAWQNDSGYTDSSYPGQIVPMSDGNILGWAYSKINGGHNAINKINASDFTLSYSKYPNGPLGKVDYYGNSASSCYVGNRNQSYPAGGNYYIHYVTSITSSPVDSYYIAVGGDPGGYGSLQGTHAKCVDSSNNCYLGLSTVGTYGRPAIIKVNTSGTVSAAVYTGSQAGVPYSMAIDSSNNVIVAMDNYGNTGFRPFGIYKFNSSLTALWDVGYTFNATVYPYATACDSSGNIYTFGQNGNGTAAIVKLNSSGAFQWGITQPSVSGNYMINAVASIKISPDNNFIYTAYIRRIASTQRILVVSKYNTSGTVQWERTLTFSNSYNFYDSSYDGVGTSHLAVTNDAVYVGGPLSNNGNAGTLNSFYAKLNPDGSGTGTYTGLGPAGSTMTYATGSYTYSSIAVNVTATPGLTWSSFTPTNSNAGPATFTNTSWTLTKGTIP